MSSLAWGEEWGSIRHVAESPEVVASDAGVARSGTTHPTEAGRGRVALVLSGGDLWRTLGRPRPTPGPGPRRLLAVDLLAVDLDGLGAHRASAHVMIGGRRWWRARAVIMNAAFMGVANLAPRAHPGDGLMDVIEGTLRSRDVREARRRAVTGTHLPHPDLATRRAAAWEGEWKRPVRVVIDGRPVGRTRRIGVRVVPAAVDVVVGPADDSDLGGPPVGRHSDGHQVSGERAGENPGEPCAGGRR